MPFDLNDRLVVGISSRALFDLEEANEVFEREGLPAYRKYQREHENDVLRPGTAFPLVKALHNLNLGDRRLTEISRLGFRRCVVPAHGKDEIRKIKGLELIPVRNIGEAIAAVLAREP